MGDSMKGKRKWSVINTVWRFHYLYFKGYLYLKAFPLKH